MTSTTDLLYQSSRTGDFKQFSANLPNHALDEVINYCAYEAATAAASLWNSKKSDFLSIIQLCGTRLPSLRTSFETTGFIDPTRMADILAVV